MCFLKSAHFSTVHSQVSLFPGGNDEKQDTGVSHIKIWKINFFSQKTVLIEVENYHLPLINKALMDYP